MPEIAVLIHPLDAEGFDQWCQTASAADRQWAETCGFTGKQGQDCLIPDSKGQLASVLSGIANNEIWSLAHLPAVLPEGNYRLDDQMDTGRQQRLALGFALGCYRFDRYRDNPEPSVTLSLEPDARVKVDRLIEGVTRVRDLVNTSTEHMGPEELGSALEALAEHHGGRFRAIVGEDLLAANLPAIHAVGRAADRAPRLLILDWGDDEDPILTLVGKGVCFDTGGLNLKGAQGMRIMKKDMGGGAHVLALAGMIMDAGLKVRLKVLIPAVENAVSGNAYRPGDVIDTRAGLTVEIGNTDAEGRVVLCDALRLASESKPDLIIDFATLTGAARVALGPDLPPLFGNDDEVIQGLLDSASDVGDPLWRMPLFDDYDSYLDSTVADLGNVADTPFAGCITAALYLRRFVGKGIPWCHLDVYAWNRASRPGRPAGGEAHGLRATFEYLMRRYG